MSQAPLDLQAGYGRACGDAAAEQPLSVWLDCDPGHDDAFAILLAAHHPRIRLLGVSTVDGNDSLRHTTRNALRILKAIGASPTPVLMARREQKGGAVPEAASSPPSAQVYPGAHVPLLRRVYDSGGGGGARVDGSGDDASRAAATVASDASGHARHIHGESGMDGFAWPSDTYGIELLSERRAVEAMAAHISAEFERLNAGRSVARNALRRELSSSGRQRRRSSPVNDNDNDNDNGCCPIRDSSTSGAAARPPVRKVKIVAVGPLTNLALLFSVHDELVPLVDVVILGGAVHTAGNVSPVAEFNLHHDPEAFQVVIAAGIDNVLLVPLDATHAVVATERVTARIGALGSTFARMLLGLIDFYAHTYREVYGFAGACLHDPVAVAAVFGVALGKFETRLERVDIDTSPSSVCRGKVVADVWCQSGRPPNVHVAYSLDVAWFWDELLGAVERANALSPLNATDGAAAQADSSTDE